MSKLAMSHFLWLPENLGPAYIRDVSAPPDWQQCKTKCWEVFQLAESESFLPYEFYPRTDKSISLPAHAVLKIRSLVDTDILAELYQQTLSAAEQDPKHIFFMRIFFSS